MTSRRHVSPPMQMFHLQTKMLWESEWQGDSAANLNLLSWNPTEETIRLINQLLMVRKYYTLKYYYRCSHKVARTWANHRFVVRYVTAWYKTTPSCSKPSVSTFSTAFVPTSGSSDKRSDVQSIICKSKIRRTGTPSLQMSNSDFTKPRKSEHQELNLLAGRCLCPK